MVRMNDYESSQPSSVQLSPFFHQVGGHSSLFEYDKNTVCKLLELPELNFYQSMPDTLKIFTPEYRGIITVEYHEDKSGNITIVAPSDGRTSNSTTSESESFSDHDNSASVESRSPSQLSDSSLSEPADLRYFNGGHIDYSNNLGVDAVNYEQGKISTAKINPWNLQLCKKQAEKVHHQLAADENTTVSQRYMLLENVTARFQHPCILDLKMGKRQYADVDSDKKRQSKIQKCEASTSSKLGVRVCGMQVYQVDSGRYVFADKYAGRKLTVDGFRSTLVQYIDNGRTRRVDVLPAIIERLESLHERIKSLLKYRFYSGSLLIVYDGCSTSDLIDVRMIDFAHSLCGTGSDEASASASATTSHVGPDQGYLFGLEQLIEVLREILRDESAKLAFENERDNPSTIEDF